jgi:predicted dehydrogenase
MGLKAGIIGLGIGETHIAGYLRHPGCDVAALCDFDEERRALLQQKYPHLKVVREADELLQDPQIGVVSIASYDNYHFEQVVKAISHGKHVFVEKPLCLAESEAEQIRSLLAEHPHIRLSSNLILRMSPRFRLLKKMVRAGDLGQPYYVESDYNYGRLEKITDGWRGKIGFYSVVLGGGVHVIDLLLWLTGDVVIDVASYGNNLSSKEAGFSYNDMVVAILKFRSGMVGKISANFGCVFPHFHQLSIYGTKATFVNGPKEARLFQSRDSAVRPTRIRSAYPGAAKGDLIFSFIDAILNNTKPEVTTDDVFNTMSVCFAIEKAVKTNQTVAVNYL